MKNPEYQILIASLIMVKGLKLCRQILRETDEFLERESRSWYGGDKFLEILLYIGTYNQLDLEELIRCINQIEWDEPENA